MKIRNIYIGSWFPKIKLHLDEFREFIKEGNISPELDAKKAKELLKKLKPKDIKTETTAKNLSEVIAQSEKGYEYSYYEDGLLLVKGAAKNFRVDRGKMLDFYQNTLTPCFAYIFSRGAKGLEVIRLPKLPKRFFVTVENESKKTIEQFFGNEKEVIDQWQDFKSFDVIFSENLIVVNLKSEFPDNQVDDLVQELVFLNEINRHLYWLLQSHRFIWEEAQNILDIPYIQTKQIPKHIDKLTIDYRNSANINSRIDQMGVVLTTRKSSLKNIVDAKWHDYFENRFNKTALEIQYMKKLFVMTSKFLQNNIKYLTSMYQEISEDAIRKLQFLFLINVVSSFLVLGTIFGANIYWYSQGELIAQGKVDSFNFSVLITFGFLTLLLSSIIYYFWNNIFKNLTRSFRK